MLPITRLPNSRLRPSLCLIAGAILGILLASPVTLTLQAQQPAAVANPARITQPVDNTVLTTLKGNVHPLARARYDQGPANASLPADRMELVLKRSSGQEIALRQFLGSLQDPNSAQYRKWLTPEQFGAQYGVSDADIQAVSAWLSSQGFKINQVNKAKTLIEFSGTIGQLENAFHTQIDRFTVNGEQHLANVSDPRIPTALTPVVAGPSRMNNFFPKPAHRNTTPGRFDKATSRMIPAVTAGTASGDALFVGPGDAATIYDTPNSFNASFTSGTAYTGANVAIGLIGFSDVNLSDIANYRSVFGLPAVAPTVVIDGSDPGADNGDGELESTLDLEASGALAPGATQYFYIAGNTNLDSGLGLEITRALNDNTVSIISLSAGECELADGESNNEYFYEAWEQAAAQGISVSVSAGDNGSAGCDDFNASQAAQFGLQVSGWASTPFNIAVGGTDYDVLGTDFSQYVSPTADTSPYTTAKSYIPENPWNESTTVNGLLSGNQVRLDSNGNPNIVAGSGGASGCVNPLVSADGTTYVCEPNPIDNVELGWPKPSWQTGSSLNIPADGVRDLPDVSLFAGDGTYNAFWLVCTSLVSGANCANSNSGFGFIGVGGTSAAAPAFAGMLALISQSQGGARLGQANYVLYNLANQASLYSSAYHDITTGNNSVYCAQNSLDCGSNLFETGYNTGGEFDLASGLGSVDVTQLVNNWSKATLTPSNTSFTINGGTSPVSITHGQAVTLTATVTGAGGTPSGDYSFVTNANEQAGTYGANANAMLYGTLSNGTSGGVSYNNLPGGTYSVSAYYGGNVDYVQSTSNSVQVSVAKEDSIVDLFAANGTSSGAPPSSSPYGTYFSLEAEPIGVSQENSSTPGNATGTVTFTDTAGPLPGGVSGTVTINSNGYAELPVYYWPVASHAVTASYGGDNSFNSSSGTANFTITQAPTSSAVTSSSTSVSGGTFTVTSLITPNPLSGAANPTGTVTLTANGSNLGSGSVTAASDSNSDSLATATITVNASSLASGANTITATYSGDSNYAGSSGTVVVTSTPVASSFALTNTAATVSSPGQSGTSTITVTPSGGYTGTVNLACVLTTAPSGANATYNPTCSLSASSVKITSTTAATATATFATTAPTSGALAYPDINQRQNRWYTAVGGATLACVLFFGIPARRRGWRSMLSLMVFLVAMAGIGCGGGGSNNNGTPGTTTGTYTFTVTGTDSVTSSTTENTVVTVTVN